MITFVDASHHTLSGLSSDATGGILAAYTWASAVSCLIAPYIFKLHHTKLLVLISAGVFSLASIAYSFIFMVPNGWVKWVAIVVRAVMGCSGGFVGNFICSSLLMIYSRRIGMISGLINMACDLGFLVAPLVGPFFYNRIGFEMTQLSAASVITAVLIWVVIAPEFDHPEAVNIPTESEGASWLSAYIKIFKCFPLMFLLLSPFINQITVCLPTAFLGTLLHDTFNLSSNYTGYVFIGMGLAYASVTPIMAYLSDIPRFNHFIAILFSPILLSLSLGIISISRVLTTPLTFIQVLVGYTASGLASGVGNGPIWGAMIRAWAYQYPNSADQTAFLTSIYLLTYPLGNAIGTTVGGFLYERMGFVTIIEVQVGLLALYSVVMLGFTLTYGRWIQREWNQNQNSLNVAVQIQSEETVSMDGLDTDEAPIPWTTI